jgi:ferredoxin-NADP reductase
MCLSDLIVKVDGPVGAPSQGYSHFPIVVLVAAGIGVTPMISVLKELLDRPGKMKRVFFYWIVRDHESFEWFSSLMQDIYDEAYDVQNQDVIMHMRPFLTSAVSNDKDLGAGLLQTARKGTATSSIQTACYGSCSLILTCIFPLSMCDVFVFT